MFDLFPLVNIVTFARLHKEWRASPQNPCVVISLRPENVESLLVQCLTPNLLKSSSSIPSPSSMTCIYSRPYSLRSTAILCGYESKEFSTNSFTAELTSWITCPLEILLDISGGSKLIPDLNVITDWKYSKSLKIKRSRSCYGWYLFISNFIVH